VPIALASDYNTDALARFLQHPLAARPAGRMPASGLSDQEAADLAAYLKKARSPSPDRSPALVRRSDSAPDSLLIETGRHQFTAQSCHACHDTGDTRQSLPSFKALAALQVDAPTGCLSAPPRVGVPDFQLNESHRRALRLALSTLQSQPEPVAITPAVAVHHYMTRMNCYACHARDGKGGVEPARADYFGSKDESAQSLGEMGYLPPSLDYTGRKLTKAWWDKLLWGEGGAVRPYLKTRMPTFGRASSEAIFSQWVAADQRTPPVTMDISGLRLHQRAHFGRILMGTNDGGLGCITCHGLKDIKAPGIAAIDLTATTQRLHPEYFKELLLNPQALQPGTRMPPMFADRSKADQEIEQLWTYLKEIDQQRLPDGLLPLGLYELKPQVAGRPLILRTFLEGAGLQAVAVGFPTQQHLAFDAAEVRWALTWQGRFLDAMSTWEERAMTPAKPLGDNLQSLPLWIPLAQLATPSTPWPTTFGEGAGYRYNGMSLNAAGVPSFHYTVATLEIADTIQPGSAAGKLRRTLQITGGGTGWFFRGLAPDASPIPVRFDPAGHASIEEELSW
jgi:mono/diheme cytochrome c family protein